MPTLQGVAALVAAIGGLLIFGLKVWIDRDDEKRRRRERVDDLVRAVFADIEVERKFLKAAFIDHAEQRLAALQRNITDRKTKPMPRAAAAGESLVIEALRRDISLLPTASVESVIEFYHVNRATDAQGTAFAKGDYDDLDTDRQIEALRAYFDGGKYAHEVAERALQALRPFIDGSVSGDDPPSPLNDRLQEG